MWGTTDPERLTHTLRTHMCFGHRMHGPDSYLVNQRCEVPSNQPDQMPQSALCKAGNEEACKCV
jgi:hypothetical protein